MKTETIEMIKRFLILVFLSMIFTLVVIAFNGCDNKETPGLKTLDITKLPLECKLYMHTIDAIKNNDGSGLLKNKSAEKSFTLAGFFANPCLNAIKEMKSNEKQKLLDQIKSWKFKNKELEMKLKFLKEKIKSK